MTPYPPVDPDRYAGADLTPPRTAAQITERDGRLSITWPEGLVITALVTPELLQGLVDQVNALRAERDQLQRRLLQGGTCCEHDPAEHTDNGCLSGWRYGPTGAVVEVGCPCKRKGVAS